MRSLIRLVESENGAQPYTLIKVPTFSTKRITSNDYYYYFLIDNFVSSPLMGCQNTN